MIDPATAANGYYTYSSQLLASSDGGESWQPRTSPKVGSGPGSAAALGRPDRFGNHCFRLESLARSWPDLDQHDAAAHTGTAYQLPGFVDALYAIAFQIPDAPGPGVYLVPTPGVLTPVEIGSLEGGGVVVYVK